MVIDADSGDDADALLMNEVLDSLIDNVAVITGDGTIVAVNSAWREYASRNGASPSLIEGVGLNHLTGTMASEIHEPSKLTLGIQSVLSGSAATYELDYPCNSPREDRWFRMAITRLQNASDRFVVIHRDVTRQVDEERERARTESTLSHAARLESVERLAGGVAHEFNNMLGVILGHAEHALQHGEAEADHVDDIVQIQRAAQRSALLVRHLLTFARRQIVTPRRIDLESTIASYLATIERRVPTNVTISFAPTRDANIIRIDPAQLELVLTNLCMNASEALTSGGWIHISTSREEFEENDSTVGYVRLSITDNGPGIAAEHLPYVFEPFFTTKAANEHAGLGLASTHGAITQLDGFVKIDTSRTSGTRVDVWIPCDDHDQGNVGPDRVGASNQADTSAAVVSRTVLVVDDEELLLELTARILRTAGWHVLTAASAEAALDAALGVGVPFDFVLTDVVLPGMDGPTLVRTLAEAGRGTPHLYMSGYTASAIGAAIQASDNFIAKPFSGRGLTDKVESLFR